MDRRAADSCRWYQCRVGDQGCRAARLGGRLLCRECREPQARLSTEKEKIMKVEKLETTATPPAAGPETVFEAIARLRAEKGLTAAETARITGRHASMYYRWKNGLSQPLLSDLEALDAAWGTDLAARYPAQAGPLGPKAPGPVTETALTGKKGRAAAVTERFGPAAALSLALHLAEALREALKLAAGPGGK